MGGAGSGVWWAGACGAIYGVIPSVACMRRGTGGIIFMWGMWLGSGYSVFLWGKNSSNKFEIKIVGKKRA